MSIKSRNLIILILSILLGGASLRAADVPIVLGGVGFSIFAPQIVKYTKADFGIRGDGEQAIIDLYEQLQ